VGVAPPAPPLRWGILSTARINLKLIAGASDCPSARIVAVASRDAARAQAYARKHRIDRGHGSYEALLADPEVDAVYISLPNALHAEWSIRALEAGKHVLCEKPLTAGAAEAERCFDAAERAGRLLMEAFMYRHNPQTRRLAEMVRGGAIGRLLLIRAAFSFKLAAVDDIRLSGELAGGGLMDVGCYCVNAARMLAGEPLRVDAESVASPAGVDLVLAATLRFPDDVIAQIDCGLALPRRSELEAIGENGLIRLRDPWHAHTPVLELYTDGAAAVQTTELAVADSYALQLQNFAAAAAGEAEPLLGRTDAVGQARTIEALYHSAASGQAVAVAS
jgi:predicted dehydrogenase